MNRMNFESYRASIGAKLNENKSKLVIPGVRDSEKGFAHTAERIMKGAENLYFSMDGQITDPVDAVFTAFSERPGLSDVDNVLKVDVVDIDIMATLQSIIGYIAVERAMDANVATVFYQGLKAINNAGGFKSGDTVFSPFMPISTMIDLGASVVTHDYSNVSGGEATITIGKTNLAPGSVVVTAYLNNEVVGTLTDLKKDGVLYSSTGGIATSASVDYAKGTVTVTGLAEAAVVDKLTVTATVDATSEADGASTLKTKPVMTAKQITATPKRLIMESSYEDTAWMNKTTYQLQAAGVSMEYGRRAIRQLIEVFTYFMDIQCINGLYKLYSTMLPLEFDLTEYSLAGSEASTKNDKLNSFIIALNTKLQKQSNFGPSCYVCDTEGAALLGNNPMYFTANANFDANLNGVVGTYRGLPVIRHIALDGKAGEGYAFIGALKKTPDGEVGPVVFGEFLAPYSVKPALNFDNPAQFASGLFAQNAVEPIVPELCAWMKVKVSG